MKRYPLYLRLHALAPWSYADTYLTAGKAQHAMTLARHRGCDVKIGHPASARPSLRLVSRPAHA